MSCYLGIDIGTFESKGTLVDPEGNILAIASRPHRMLVPRPGWAEHRPKQDWWGDFCRIAKELIATARIDPKTIRAVGASAIGPCMLPVDADGEALTNGVLYGVDTRAAKEIAELTDRIGGDVILERCGNALTSQSVGPKILWLKNNRRDAFERAAKIVSSTTYIVQKLTGECVIDHYTAANFSPLYRVDRREWSDDLARDIIGLDRLPRLAWSTEIVGKVTRMAAAASGLAVGTPVITGTIDAASEALSVGVVRPGDMMIMYGSTIFTVMLSAERIADPRLWYAPWLFPDLHGSMAGLATSGTLTHWFRDIAARELDPAKAFAALAEEAGTSPPGARGLVMLPYFSGERTPIHDTHAKGVLFGLNLTHDRGDIYRALLEGIACGTTHILETYDEIGQTPRRLRAVGGGTRNAVWSQATSDISGRRQEVCARTLGACFGDAFLAALAVGDVRRGDIGTWNPVERRIAPRKRFADVYSRQYRAFKDIYASTRGIMKDLSA